MTHGELLAKIDYDIEGNPYDEYMSALRAVVILCDFLDKKGKSCVPVEEIIHTIERELG
jgi:hypothetical protein